VRLDVTELLSLELVAVGITRLALFQHAMTSLVHATNHPQSTEVPLLGLVRGVQHDARDHLHCSLPWQDPKDPSLTGGDDVVQEIDQTALEHLIP